VDRKYKKYLFWPLIFNEEFPADEYSRTQSSSVSPRGYCNSSASTPHSTGGSGGYGTPINGYGPPISGISSPVPSANVFNSTSSEFLFTNLKVDYSFFYTFSLLPLNWDYFQCCIETYRSWMFL
jgi:hypothetical protein